jgi:hypothetical protein|tara:strand:+ start:2531 stop:2647 length:117 start_codon:yes stop_codon:yes gene_type:complete
MSLYKNEKSTSLWSEIMGIATLMLYLYGVLVWDGAPEK